MKGWMSIELIAGFVGLDPPMLHSCVTSVPMTKFPGMMRPTTFAPAAVRCVPTGPRFGEAVANWKIGPAPQVTVAGLAGVKYVFIKPRPARFRPLLTS